jgi:tight adherence protein B
MGHPAIWPVIVVFVAVVGVIMAISEILGRKKTTGGLRNRIDGLTTTNQPMQSQQPTSTSAWAAQPTLTNKTGSLSSDRPDFLPTITKYVSGNEIGKKLRLEMHRAGMRLRPAEFVGLCLGGIVIMAMVGEALTKQMFMAIAMGIIGYGIPLGILKFMQAQRAKKFADQLPDALTLISSSLRTGYSFLNATELVISEMPPPISEEFAWARGEAQLGVPMETALQRMVARINSYDLDLVVTSVSIQLQVGGNLAEILNTISETIRERIRIKGEIAALTAEGKLSGVIVFCLPIILVLILNVVAPGYFTPLLKHPLCLPIVGGTVALMLIGGAMIQKMVAVDV